jgi:hypothetical protein
MYKSRKVAGVSNSPATITAVSPVSDGHHKALSDR